MEYFYMPVKHQVYIFVNAFVVVIQSLSCIQFFLTPDQALLSFTISQTLLKLLSIESVMLSNLSSSVTHFSYPQSSQHPGLFQ